MSVTLIVISVIIVGFLGVIIFNYRKMKNMPVVADNENIKKLNNKNFKAQTRSGIVLVDFWAPWCGPCKVIAPILNDIAKKDSDKITIGKINVDHQGPVAQKFKVKSIPTLILFKDGKEVNRFAGVKTRKFIMNEVAKISD